MLQKIVLFLAASIAVSGCGAKSEARLTPNNPETARRHIAAARSTRTLFVADLLADAILMYPANVNNPALLGKITVGVSGPKGTAVDASGVLYVANQSNRTVTEYQPGQTQPFRVLQTGSARPESLAVDPAGNVFVGSNLGNSVVLVKFAAGSTKPAATIPLTKERGIPFMGGITVDTHDNVYVAFFIYDIQPGHVLKFSRGSNAAVDLHLQGIQLPLNMGLATDSAGNLYVGNNDVINVYAPGSTAPQRVISNGLAGVTKFAVDGSGAVYAPVFTGSMGSSIQEFAPNVNSPNSGITGFAMPTSVSVFNS